MADRCTSAAVAAFAVHRPPIQPFVCCRCPRFPKQMHRDALRFEVGDTDRISASDSQWSAVNERQSPRMEEADQAHRISPGTVCVTCETKSQRCLFFYKYKKCVTYNDLFLTLTKRYCPNLKNCEAMLTMWQRSDVIHYVSFLRSHWQSTYSFV